MFESLKSVKTLEKNLRKWHVENSVRILGKSRGPEAAEDADSISIEDLVQDVATYATTQIKHSEQMRSLTGYSATGPDEPGVAYYRKGLRLAQAIVKAKGWRLQRDAAGYYKVE